MISGLYSAATAMDVTNRRHEMVSENLANLQTPGDRRRVLSQPSFDTLMQPLQVATDGVDSSKLLGATTGDTQYDFSQGHIQGTKLKLDVALNGEGFFTVQSPEGPLYTRSGAFHLDPEGTLVNVDGQPILGIGGPIQVPAGMAAEQIEITNDGSVYANDQQIGQLALVQFADNNTLTAVGASLFPASPGAVTIVVAEYSNVDNNEDKSMSKSTQSKVKADFEASSKGGLAGRTFTEEMADVTAESGLQVQTSEKMLSELLQLVR